MKLSGKRALVTGAGQGIGKGCALELARAGADLVINDRPGSEEVEATADEIRAMGRGCQVITANIFERDECERLVSEALEALGRLDILVSNPAASRRCDFLDIKAEDFEFVINGALTSGFHISQLVARDMVKHGGGKIVFISSVHAYMPYGLSASYNAAKAGLNHLAKTIATELTQHRINVNVIEPGWIDTPGERKAFGEERMKQEAANMPWGRLGVPEDIGKAAAFLASDDADYITGSVLRVDGGIVLKDCRAEDLINAAE
ncbi:MAG: glucose 1-dehydrogenase [Verrucomicrobiales bacterium]|nr:glucose 1-dehydrogenase [Verrucomicrobiales bacterium]